MAAIKRRRLRGKKLLVASAGLASASLFSCSESATANLVPPPDATMPEDGAADAETDAEAQDAATDGASDARARDADSSDADSFDATLVDAPVANLVPPPDSGFGEQG